MNPLSATSSQSLSAWLTNLSTPPRDRQTHMLSRLVYFSFYCAATYPSSLTEKGRAGACGQVQSVIYRICFWFCWFIKQGEERRLFQLSPFSDSTASLHTYDFSLLPVKLHAKTIMLLKTNNLTTKGHIFRWPSCVINPMESVPRIPPSSLYHDKSTVICNTKVCTRDYHPARSSHGQIIRP